MVSALLFAAAANTASADPTLDETKQQFRTDGWFNEQHGPEKLAKSYAAMNLRSRTTDKAGTGYHYREPLWH